jgi:hypothetical protein
MFFPLNAELFNNGQGRGGFWAIPNGKGSFGFITPNWDSFQDGCFANCRIGTK